MKHKFFTGLSNGNLVGPEADAPDVVSAHTGIKARTKGFPGLDKFICFLNKTPKEFHHYHESLLTNAVQDGIIRLFKENIVGYRKIAEMVMEWEL